MLKPNLKYLSLLSSFFIIVLCFTSIPAQKMKPKTSTKPMANAKEKDVQGWQDTRWGMTKADIKKVFSTYISTGNDTSIKETRLVCENLCALLNYRIADESFSVFFNFDDKTKGLKQISISPTSVETSIQMFEELEKLLTIKYGQFKHKNDEILGVMVDRSRLWVFPTTTIELRQRYLKKDSKSMTEIFFRPFRSSEANKL